MPVPGRSCTLTVARCEDDCDDAFLTVASLSAASLLAVERLDLLDQQLDDRRIGQRRDVA